MPETVRAFQPIFSGAARRAQILIAVDGGRRLGYGHVGRCLALWEELDTTCAFTTAEPSVADYLRQRGVAVALEDYDAEVVVLDRAAPVDPEEVRRRQRAGSRVALVDDAGPARELADVVIDPPTGALWPPSRGRRLGGFEHALLRRDVRAASASALPGVDVLVSMGGSDPTELTPVVVDALQGNGIRARAVLGPGYVGRVPPRVVPPANWLRALAGATLLITRFGHTLLEAAHLGVPAIALAVDERSRTNAKSFAVHGSARWIDSGDTAGLVALAGELLADESARADMAQSGRRLVDGLGAHRVARALAELV